MDRKQIEKIIKLYIGSLSKKIEIERVILFGSSVRGKLGKDRDIDLLIISPSFAQIETASRFDLLYTARTNPDVQKIPMDIFGLTPEEYQRASHLSIVGEIKDKGKEISLP